MLRTSVYFLFFLFSSFSLFSNPDVIKDYLSLENVLNDNQDKIWKGYTFAQQPTVLVLPEGTLIAIHLDSANSLWKSTEDHIQISSEDHWNVSKIHMQADFPIDGKNAFLFRLSSSELEKGLRILVHEKFHVYQRNQFKNLKTVTPYLKDYDNIENLSLAFLENLMLMDYLKSNRTSMDSLKNFLAVYTARQKLLSTKSIEWENEQQKIEGLAEYVSYRALELYKGLPKQEILISLLQDPKHPLNKDYTVHRRHYGVGAVMAMALDHLQVKEWKQKIENDESTLISLLQSSIPVEDADERLKVIKLRYQYDSLYETLQEVSTQFKNYIDSLLHEYNNAKGIVVIIHPPTNKCMGGGTNMGMLLVKDNTRLILNDTSTTTTNDNDWSLSLKQMPFHFQHHDGAHEIKESHDLEITIDGQNVLLGSVKDKTPFQALQWSSDKSTFSSRQYSGVISVQDGNITITYK
jgi:hypothetical protein